MDASRSEENFSVPVEVVPTCPPAPPAPPRRRSRFALLLLLLLLLALGGSILGNVTLLGLVGLQALESDSQVQEKFVSGSPRADDKIAIISIEGTILGGDESFAKKQIDRARKDESVKALVLRVDSPGGTVSGSDYLYYHLQQLIKDRQIPLVVSMGSMAASGGYYVAMAVGDQPQSIFAEPTTWTGSIGVIIPHYDLAGLLDQWGIKNDSVASHRLKSMGSFTKTMTAEERKIFQGLIDDGFGRFKDVIRNGRPAFRDNAKALDEVATGQIFTAPQAQRHGLIDTIGFLEDAVARAAELAGVDADQVQVVKYKKQVGLGALFTGESRAAALNLSALLETHAPRAYFLYTSLPPLLTSRGD